VSASPGRRRGSCDGDPTPNSGDGVWWGCTHSWVPGKEAPGCAAAGAPWLRSSLGANVAPMGASLWPHHPTTLLAELQGVDQDGHQEHRGGRQVLQRPHHQGVRPGHLARGTLRPEDPTAQRAPGRGGGQDPQRHGGVGAGGDVSTRAVQVSLLSRLRVAAAGFPTDGELGGGFL